MFFSVYCFTIIVFFSNANPLLTMNNQTLPLAYFECKRIRFIVPSVEVGSSKISHDVCMFQVERISLNPTAVNPICRTPCRPDIYQQAAQARILNIPGKYHFYK